MDGAAMPAGTTALDPALYLPDSLIPVPDLPSTHQVGIPSSLMLLGVTSYLLLGFVLGIAALGAIGGAVRQRRIS